MASCSLIFEPRLLSQSFCMLACTQTPWFVYMNPKKARKHSWSINFHKSFVVFYSHTDSAAVRSNHFLLVEWLFDAKVLLNGHAVTQNYVFVVFQSEATKNNTATNWSDTLKRHQSWKSLCNLEQTSTSWQINLTVWLRFLTLIQSLLVIKPIFCHNLPSSYI